MPLYKPTSDRVTPMIRLSRRLAALLIVCLFGVLSAAQGQQTAPASSADAAPKNYRIIIAEPQPAPAPSSEMQAVEKRLEQLIQHEEATSRILRQMAEGMAARPGAPVPAAAPASAPAGIEATLQ